MLRGTPSDPMRRTGSPSHLGWAAPLEGVGGPAYASQDPQDPHGSTAAGGGVRAHQPVWVRAFIDACGLVVAIHADLFLCRSTAARSLGLQGGGCAGV